MLKLDNINAAVPRTIEELKGRTDPEAVKAVAKEMEAMFAYEMIKAMRSSMNSGSATAFGADTYMSMFDLEISKLFAERGLGLQDTFIQGMRSSAEKGGPRSSGSTPAANNAAGAFLADEIKTLLPDVTHARLTSAYGARQDPLGNGMRFHRGVDIAAPEGTPIHPVRAGTVAFSGAMAGYGNTVIVDHGDGFRTTYAHNLSNLVREGELVDAGSVIAHSGSTGRSTGPHVHFEVQHNGNSVDPLTTGAQQ